MSYLLKLYKTYEANLDQVNRQVQKENGKIYTLLPIGHTTQTAHIEVSITPTGEFLSATILGKNGEVTVIPGESRGGSGIDPYPLHDKLSYVAGDYVSYAKKVGKRERKLFPAYIQQLEKWATSSYATGKIQSIYQYLKKGTLISDLIQEGILYTDSQGKLIEKWGKKKEKKPPIFQVVSGELKEAFCRFTVDSPHEVYTKVWHDEELQRSYIRFIQEMLKEEDYCYVLGKWLPRAEKHAHTLRYAGDMAKLISSKDESGFTYRGRFKTSSQVASMSYEASQKAHNTLKWLIQKQAKVVDDRVFLVWGIGKTEIPNPVEEDFSFIPIKKKPRNKPQSSYTYDHFAKEMGKAIDSYRHDLSDHPDVNILVLDSATKGRLAVLYYRSLRTDDYLDRLKRWHTTCVWELNDGQGYKFYGAPSMESIATAAYGSKANKKVVIERMLPCIMDGRNIPFDVLQSAFHRACQPMALNQDEWEKTLSTACALINKQEGYDVALDKENTDRNYLFGRLLAIADVIERRALDKGGDDRATNAIRYMNEFSRYPERTWKTIQEALQPYQIRLGNKGIFYSQLIDEIASKFNFEDFNNQPLNGKYLLGFYSQRREFYQKRTKAK